MANIRYTLITRTPTNHAERPLLVLGSQTMLHPTRVGELVDAVDAFCERIDAGQLFVHAGPADFLGALIQLLANGGVGLRQVVQAFTQGFVIQHGAATQHGVMPACPDFLNQAAFEIRAQRMNELHFGVGIEIQAIAAKQED